jgi:hypothetical protein
LTIAKAHVKFNQEAEIQQYKVESFDRTSSDALGYSRERVVGGKLVDLLREKDPGATGRNRSQRV